MFAPILFIGGMFGGAFGGVAHRWWPFPAASPEAYMLVGMGTFFAGVFRSPITSIFLVFEVSASYVIILPVMIANITAYLLSRKLYAMPFFKMTAKIEGVALPSAEEKRNFQPLRVEDAMHTLASPIPAEDGMRLFPDEPLDAALRLLAVRPRIQVVSRLRTDEVIGTLTLEDVHLAYGIAESREEAGGLPPAPAHAAHLHSNSDRSSGSSTTRREKL
jgi:CIC family chloride channel protein